MQELNDLPMVIESLAFPGGASGKEPAWGMRFWVLGEDDLLEEGMATHSGVLAGESQGQRSLEGYSPWFWKESDKTEAT